MFVRVLFPSTQTHRSIISPSSTSNSSANTAKSAAFKIVGGNNYDGDDGGTNAEELVDMVRKKKSNMSNRDLTKSKRAPKEADNTDDDGTSDSNANGGSIVVVCQVKLPLDIVDYETLPQTERGLYNSPGASLDSSDSNLDHGSKGEEGGGGMTREALTGKEKKFAFNVVKTMRPKDSVEGTRIAVEQATKSKVESRLLSILGPPPPVSARADSVASTDSTGPVSSWSGLYDFKTLYYYVEDAKEGEGVEIETEGDCSGCEEEEEEGDRGGFFNRDEFEEGGGGKDEVEGLMELWGKGEEGFYGDVSWIVNNDLDSQSREGDSEPDEVTKTLLGVKDILAYRGCINIPPPPDDPYSPASPFKAPSFTLNIFNLPVPPVSYHVYCRGPVLLRSNQDRHVWRRFQCTVTKDRMWLVGRTGGGGGNITVGLGGGTRVKGIETDGRKWSVVCGRTHIQYILKSRSPSDSLTWRSALNDRVREVREDGVLEVGGVMIKENEKREWGRFRGDVQKVVKDMGGIEGGGGGEIGSRDEIRKAVISGVVEIMGLVEGWKRVYRGMEREQHKYVKVEKLGEVRERGRKSRVRIIEIWDGVKKTCERLLAREERREGGSVARTSGGWSDDYGVWEDEGDNDDEENGVEREMKIIETVIEGRDGIGITEGIWERLRVEIMKEGKGMLTRGRRKGQHMLFEMERRDDEKGKLHGRRKKKRSNTLSNIVMNAKIVGKKYVPQRASKSAGKR
ncbi:hypothetical protein TrCOL_g872 [Triparma columacea]|uniref:PH domain-containing protein n=1 Tax=Triparma columacea TaxID=722753 RepID=A0A9W7G407_9STRA|nr:hypothetical protein TrCOL_g872 [Triparma columacea]